MHKNVHIIFHFISLFVLTLIRLIRNEKKQGPKPPPFSMLLYRLNFKASAEGVGLSVNEFINEAIDEKMVKTKEAGG